MQHQSSGLPTPRKIQGGGEPTRVCWANCYWTGIGILRLNSNGRFITPLIDHTASPYQHRHDITSVNASEFHPTCCSCVIFNLNNTNVCRLAADLYQTLIITQHNQILYSCCIDILH